MSATTLDIINIEFLKALPKADLHVHLNGIVRPETLCLIMNSVPASMFDELIRSKKPSFSVEKNLQPFLQKVENTWTVADVKKLFAYTSFMGFIATWYFVDSFFTTSHHLRLLCDGAFQTLHEEGVLYAEVIVSIWEWIEKGIRCEELVRVLTEAAEHHSSRVQIFYLIDFVNTPNKAIPLSHSIDLLLNTLKHSKQISKTCRFIGVNYSHCVPSLSFLELKELYQVARENGLHTTIHAGEADSCDHILAAIDIIGVERIGHGLLAQKYVPKEKDDKDDSDFLMRKLKEKQIPLEICLSSNLCTRVVNSLEEHPLRKFLQFGVPVALCTDDPTFFHTSLANEILLAQQQCLISQENLFQCLVAQWKFAFGLSEEEKRSRVEQLRAKWK